MKVKELIEKLNAMKPDAIIMIPSGYDGYNNVADVYASKAEVGQKMSGTSYYEPEDYDAPDNIEIVVID